MIFYLNPQRVMDLRRLPIRLNKIATLDKDLILGKIGQVEEIEVKQIYKEIVSMFQPDVD
jgi:hypothetical protein